MESYGNLITCRKDGNFLLYTEQFDVSLIIIFYKRIKFKFNINSSCLIHDGIVLKNTQYTPIEWS